MKVGKIVYGFSETPEETPMIAMAKGMAKARAVEITAISCADAAVAYLEHVEVHDGLMFDLTCTRCQNLWAAFEQATHEYRAAYE